MLAAAKQRLGPISAFFCIQKISKLHKTPPELTFVQMKRLYIPYWKQKSAFLV
jgi:hypothetical protein